MGGLTNIRERVKQVCKNELIKGTSIETINKYVNILCEATNISILKGYGENVRNVIIDNINDIAFYIDERETFI